MAKQRKPWEQLFDTVKVNRDPKQYVRPLDAELDELEAQLGSRLPHTYREFMKRFGPGELKRWVNLHVITEKKRAHGQTVLDHTIGARQFFSHLGDLWKGKNLTQLVVFASSVGGDMYAWDPVTVTSRSSHECQFYYLPRTGEKRSVPAGAVAPIPEFTLQLQVFWFLAVGNSPLSGVAERVGTLHTLAPKLC